MHTNWQVCSLVVQAKSERISDISTQPVSYTHLQLLRREAENEER